jgi:hypothetical protein
MTSSPKLTKLLVLTLTTLFILATPTLTFDCKKEKGCKSCNLHKEECEIGSCHNKYFWNNDKCNEATPISGCWLYEYTTNATRCKVCLKDYYLSSDGMTCNPQP